MQCIALLNVMHVTMKTGSSLPPTPFSFNRSGLSWKDQDLFGGQLTTTEAEDTDGWRLPAEHLEEALRGYQYIGFYFSVEKIMNKSTTHLYLHGFVWRQVFISLG